MSRRRYLVAYDIRDDRRLRAVANCTEGYGDRIQFSVFVCDLSDTEKFAMRADLESRMNQSEDSVNEFEYRALPTASRSSGIARQSARGTTPRSWRRVPSGNNSSTCRCHLEKSRAGGKPVRSTVLERPSLSVIRC